MKFSEYRNASNCLTIEVEGMPSLAYRFVRWRLCRQFELTKASDYVKGLDEKFQSFASAQGKVSIDWDNWSGFTVVALDTPSEPLLLNIKSWLQNKYA